MDVAMCMPSGTSGFDLSTLSDELPPSDLLSTKIESILPTPEDQVVMQKHFHFLIVRALNKYMVFLK